MAIFADGRIPVVFGAEPAPGDAVVVAGGSEAHAAGCACCVARSPDAAGLDRLFLQRVRAEVPWFNRVVVLGEAEALRAAIVADPVLIARFRLG